MIDFEAAVQGISVIPSRDAPPPVDAEEEARKKIFGPTLNEDGSLRCVSPSQYKTHKMCNLKWYLDKKLKWERKEKSKGAKLGTECHGREEKYLKTGVDIRGPIEKHGHEMIEPYLSRAPFNGGDMLVEEPLLNPQLVTPGGIRISGFSDVTLPPYWDPATLDENGNEVTRDPIVIDHKFRKNLELYAETAEQLADGDPQAVIYPHWALTKWPQATGCEFRHHNHQTEKARKNLPVSITDDRATVFAKWLKLAKYIDEDMARTALIPDLHDVPANETACRAFGGCDFINQCPKSPHNRYMNALALGTGLPEITAPSRAGSQPPTEGYDLMGLLDEVMNEKLAVVLPATTASAARTPLPPLEALACKPGGVYMLPGGRVAKFEGAMGERCLFKNAEGTLMECAGSDFVRDLSGDPVSVGLFAPKVEAPKERKLKIEDVSTPDTTPKIDPAAGIVPKDAPPDTNPKTAQTPVEATVAGSTAASGNPGQSAQAATAGTPAAGTEVQAESTVKKAGRPPGSKNKPKVASDQLIVLVNNSCPAAEDLTPYVQGLCDALAKKAGVSDVRLGEKGSDLSYGGWKAILTVMAKTNPPPAGLYVVQRSELAEPVIEALAGSGAIVSYGG